MSKLLQIISSAARLTIEAIVAGVITILSWRILCSFGMNILDLDPYMISYICIPIALFIGLFVMMSLQNIGKKST